MNTILIILLVCPFAILTIGVLYDIVITFIGVFVFAFLGKEHSSQFIVYYMYEFNRTYIYLLTSGAVVIGYGLHKFRSWWDHQPIGTE